ncbi:MAG TPA: antitoxin Xre-like helix-turn-helix domain-containing protein [Sphingomicrobium sp.]|nr:antitoxin Xre-like helix-turn-helix domain-containing protein [Sphingomicrobium sp.]
MRSRQQKRRASKIPERQTFAAANDRRRAGPVALKASVQIFDRWGATRGQAAALLGVSVSTWDRIKAGTWKGVLSQDQLTRASAMVAIFTGLHMLVTDETADQWPALPNRFSLFEHQSPIYAMIDGGVPRMLEVRRRLEALIEHI